MNNFKTFTTREERDHITDDSARARRRNWVKEKIELAKTIETFGGKRLLGVTDKDIPIYVKYTFDKNTLDIKISLTHTEDAIRKAKLCPRKVTAALHESINVEHAMRPKTKKDHGEVTQRTIDYILKLIEKSSLDYYRENKQVTSLMFMYISNCIYSGSHEPGKVRWMDIKQGWNLPQGMYFTIDG